MDTDKAYMDPLFYKDSRPAANIIGIQHHGIDGILITYIGDPPLPCVSVLASNPSKAEDLADRAREILMLLRK